MTQQERAGRQSRGRLARMAPTLLCLAVIAVTLPAMHAFPRAYFTPRMILGYDDRWAYFLPNSFFMDACVHRGELPLWNPLILCGSPFAANPQSGLFYPPNLLRSLIVCNPTPMKTEYSLLVFSLLHLAMAGLATFALARRHGLSVAGSITAMFGFIYAQPLSVSFWSQTNVLATVSWLPVILLCLNRGMCAERFSQRVCYSLLAGMSFGMALLAGFPEHALYVALFVASYAVLFPLLRAGGADARRRTRLKSVLEAAALLAVAFAVAVLIAAAMFLPAAELTRLSMRNAPVSLHAAQPSLANLVAVASGGVLLLVAAGLTHPRKRDLGIFVAVALLFLCCSLGPPFPVATVLRACAPWQLGDPLRAARHCTLPLGILAGFGVDALACSPVRKSWSRARSLFLLAIGSGLTVVLLRGTRLADTMIFWSGASTTLWAFGPLVVAAVLAGRLPAYRRVWLVGLPVLVLVELGIWHDQLARGAEKIWFFPGDIQSVLHTPSMLSTANQRGVSYPENCLMYQLRFATTGYEPTMLSDVWRVVCRPGMEAQYGKALSAQDCTAANPWGNLFLKRPFWLTEQYVPGRLPTKDAVFPPTTVAFVQGPAELPVRCLERADVLRQSVSENRSRIELTGSIRNTTPDTGKRDGLEIEIGPIPPVAPTGQPPQHSALYLQCGASGEVLVATTFLDPSSGESTPGRECHFSATTWKSWLVEVPMPDFAQLVAKVSVKYLQPQSKFAVANAYLLKDEADLNAHLTITERWANSVKVAVSDLKKHSVLMFVEAAYPGWRAYVDGQETPIWRANNAFQAVVLPPGDHQVEFRFRPVRVYLGLAISLLAFAAASAAALFSWSRSRRPALDGRSAGMLV